MGPAHAVKGSELQETRDDEDTPAPRRRGPTENLPGMMPAPPHIRHPLADNPVLRGYRGLPTTLRIQILRVPPSEAQRGCPRLEVCVLAVFFGWKQKAVLAGSGPSAQLEAFLELGVGEVFPAQGKAIKLLVFPSPIRTKWSTGKDELGLTRVLKFIHMAFQNLQLALLKTVWTV